MSAVTSVDKIDQFEKTADRLNTMLPIPTLSENALAVLNKRYLKRDEEGNVTETAVDMFMRVANTVSSAEVKFGASSEEQARVLDEFYGMMATGKFMPNSPTLMNAGRKMGQLSACFVIPIEDSIDSIFNAIKATATIQKAAGGTGFSLDRLRPSGDWISSSGGTTSGPLSFWKVLNETTTAIQQGAFRRGASMAMMSITHPDILKFIFSKQEKGAFENFNISIKITDAWMKQLKEGPNNPTIVTNYRTSISYWIPKSVNPNTYTLKDLEKVSGTNCDNSKYWSYKDLYGVIVHNAWQTGEPGVCFIDVVNAHNSIPVSGPIESSNPCGEQFLPAWGSCQLGSINLIKFVLPDNTINWKDLGQTVKNAVRFLDNSVEVNNYVIPQIGEVAKANRNVGLGIMGFADLLFKIGVPYDSDDGLAWADRIMSFIQTNAHDASEELAVKRGNFPAYEGSTWQTKHKRKQRTSATTTVAPTGTISIIADCSCGIEPIFSLAFLRNVMQTQLKEFNSYFESVAKKAKYWGYEREKLFDLIMEHGTIASIPNIPDNVKKVFVSAHDVAPEWHVKMQAAFQKHCDNAISKTINLPHDAKEETVDTVYKLAYTLGCKGVTVYRDGCRMNQPMALTAKEEKPENKPVTLIPTKTASILPSVRIRVRSPQGNCHIVVVVDPKTEREMEVFASVGKAGDLAFSDSEAICRMISIWLRSGGTIEMVIHQLDGIGSSTGVATKDGQIQSLGSAIACGLKRYKAAKTKFGLIGLLTGKVDLENIDSVKDTKKSEMYKIKCPSCKTGILQYVEGCKKCVSCGYSEC